MKKTLILIALFTVIGIVSYFVADAFPDIVRN
jgi:hypothetical protein